jgi:general secretion pathway protein F
VLAEQPQLFPPLYVGIVKAAEGTSDLPRSLSRYIDYQQRIDLVRGKIVSAAIYPCILLLVGGGVSMFLIGYVVPRFAEVYQGAGRNLPWMSQLMLSWGQFAGAHTGPLLAALALRWPAPCSACGGCWRTAAWCACWAACRASANGCASMSCRAFT